MLTFGDAENEKKNYRHKSSLFKIGADIEKYQYLTIFLLVKRTINTLLVTCIMIIKFYNDHKVSYNASKAYVNSYDRWKN